MTKNNAASQFEAMKQQARAISSLPAAARQAFEEAYPRASMIVEERFALEMTMEEERYDQKQRDLLKDLYRWFGKTLRGIYAFHLYERLIDEAVWLASVLSSRRMGGETAGKVMESWSIAIHGVIKPPEADALAYPLTWLRAQMPTILDCIPLGVEEIPADVQKYVELTLSRKRREAADYVLSFLNAGLSPEKICNGLIMPALKQFGHLWQKNLLSATEEHSATNITRYVIFRLFDSRRREKRLRFKALVSCVPGDEHEISAEMMAEVLDSKGWLVEFIGRSAPREDIVETAKDVQPDVVFLSVSLIAHLPAARALVREIKKKAPGAKTILAGPAAVAAQDALSETADAVASSLEKGYTIALTLAGEDA